MATNLTVNSWQYARWVKVIGRNMRITEPEGAELAAVKTFLKAIWNPVLETGSREWLDTSFEKKAVNASDEYKCDIDSEPTHVLVELIAVVAKDMNKIPVIASPDEEALVDALIAATGTRRLGTGPTFGGTVGSIVG